jgi:hypothetical protein
VPTLTNTPTATATPQGRQPTNALPPIYMPLIVK